MKKITLALWFCCSIIFLKEAIAFDLPKYELPVTINGVTYEHGAIQFSNSGQGSVLYYNQAPGEQLPMCYCQCHLPLNPTVYTPYDRWDIFFSEATICQFDSSTTECTWVTFLHSNLGMGTYAFINGEGGQAYSDMDWVTTDSGLCSQGALYKSANWTALPHASPFYGAVCGSNTWYMDEMAHFITSNGEEWVYYMHTCENGECGPYTLEHMPSGIYKWPVSGGYMIKHAFLVYPYKLVGGSWVFQNCIQAEGYITDLIALSEQAYNPYDFSDIWTANTTFGSHVGPPETETPVRKSIAVTCPAAGVAVCESTNTKAVLITHGFNATAFDWVTDMALGMCAKVGATQYYSNFAVDSLIPVCSGGGWDVWVNDWSTNAISPAAFPSVIWVNAATIGYQTATYFLQQHPQYKHFHLIAHSAGSNLIDTATPLLKSAGATVHATFLDAYDPRALLHPTLTRHISTYGKDADWADNYVDTRPLSGDIYGTGLDFNLDTTDLHLQYGYNIDVTPPSDSDGCEDVTGPNFVCRHSRPYRFYGKSVIPGFLENDPSEIGDPVVSTVGMGYPLSEESGRTVSELAAQYRKNEGCWATSAGCTPGSTYPPSFWSFFPGALAETTVDSVNGVVDIAISGATNLWELADSIILGVDWALSPSSRASRLTARTMFSAATTTGEVPSWAVLHTTTSEPVNTLRFNWHFASAGEGYVRIFVDDVLVREMDQRYLPEQSSKPEEVYVGDLAPGRHKVAIRLDGFGASASGVQLTNVELGARVLVTAIANAGSPRTVRQGSLVTLDGTASSDSDNGPLPLSFLWTQVGTPEVTLNGATTSKPTFTPSVKGTYTFNIVVNDGQASSAPASVAITVPTLGDIDLDGDVDNNDLNLVVAARNKPASSPNDLRDLDGNMKIDALDARKLTTLCTRLRCATQ